MYFHITYQTVKITATQERETRQGRLLQMSRIRAVE